MSKEIYGNKVAIVTGASAGIGAELARQLAGFGAKVVLASRDEDRLEKLAEECRESGGEVLVVKTDVADKEQCKRLIEKTIETFGRIDSLFNNAGYGVTSRLLDLTDLSLYDHQMQVNFNGSVYCTYYALPHLVETNGRLCGVSSVAGWFSMAGSSIYNASKFAMRGFFDSIRQEMIDKGVSVTMIYPGYVVTEFAANVVTTEGKKRGEKALKFYKPSMMSARRCAEIVLKKTAKRKREVLMTLQANIAIWIKRLFPGVIDKIVSDYHKKREAKYIKLKNE